ncbi:uncharacterized protein STEHIDRAFT_147607 [Stereum hirsutum FP-91666 SS1]|uniref:uncharacterized protein n=1 Tax=Stereum hirsutum (strain FP-91666) TaxID=721885 RepID=UPI0004449A20|nr:uncharacterized protein STEHIDRAFT_147607 [Stereum hirsutum FP-91666 SS1]EIM86087.1 hypothetical protein STEHIDRAFT_147607 [Stereum hirsutum FP-91666 SS1]
MDNAVEFQESKSITFEWTLRGLKNLFESSKGEAKSKVTKSVKFGGGRWQILFYPNSGTGTVADGSGYISLFLSCEPTLEEKENAVNGRWVRDGLFRFTFELRNLSKQELFNSKEAHNHSFSWKTANWGWAQFARRDTVYYSRHNVKAQDAFVMVCTITTEPASPQPSSIPRMSVPKELLDAFGSMLDDPMYSDIEFVLPRRGGGMRSPRKIYAAKKLLCRADYFESMFGAGFAEASTDNLTLAVNNEGQSSDMSETASQMTALQAHYDDSDEEDEDMDPVGDTDFLLLDYAPRAGAAVTDSEQTSSNEDGQPALTASTITSTLMTPEPQAQSDQTERATSDDEGQRNVRQKLSHPSSPRSSPPPELPANTAPHTKTVLPGPVKQRVTVKDVAYTTYRAVLHYLYTDTIRFAPLSSSFLSTPPPAPIPTSASQTPAGDSQSQLGATLRTQGDSFSSFPARSRRDWLQQWQQNNPGKPLPCSAKAVYRLADKLDLRELKERAFQHVIRSLTVENVPYEVFSNFSATFESVRKVEVKFFLDNWTDIRGSDAMRSVWHQIRLGRHPGFEEVWPVIATNLEFKPQSSENTDKDPARVA